MDVLLYNHILAGPDQPPAQPAAITVTLQGLASNTSARIQLIDEDHTNPYRQWLALGSPEYPTRAQLRTVNQASELHSHNLNLTRNHGGELSFKLTLPAEGVAAIRITNSRH